MQNKIISCSIDIDMHLASRGLLRKEVADQLMLQAPEISHRAYEDLTKALLKLKRHYRRHGVNEDDIQKHLLRFGYVILALVRYEIEHGLNGVRDKII